MWEEFWSVVEEYDLPVNIHILTRQGGPQVGANAIVDGVVLPVPAFKTIAEMITGGVFERHPHLKIISVENDIGWIPNYLEAAGVVFLAFRPAVPPAQDERCRLLAAPGLRHLPGRCARACAAAT